MTHETTFMLHFMKHLSLRHLTSVTTLQITSSLLSEMSSASLKSTKRTSILHFMKILDPGVKILNLQPSNYGNRKIESCELETSTADPIR